jgi:hypothetical protein
VVIALLDVEDVDAVEFGGDHDSIPFDPGVGEADLRRLVPAIVEIGTFATLLVPSLTRSVDRDRLTENAAAAS